MQQLFFREISFQRVPNQAEKLQKFQGWGSRGLKQSALRERGGGEDMDIFWDYAVGLPCMMI